MKEGQGNERKGGIKRKRRGTVNKGMRTKRKKRKDEGNEKKGEENDGK